MIMKRILMSFVMAAFLIIGMVQCSGGGSTYNPQKCEQLKEKISNNEEMSDQDYNEMIDQMVGMMKYLKNKETEFKENPEKMKEFEKSEEGYNMVGYLLGFGFYLESKKKDLSPEIQKKLEDAEAEVKALNLD